MSKNKPMNDFSKLNKSMIKKPEPPKPAPQREPEDDFDYTPEDFLTGKRKESKYYDPHEEGLPNSEKDQKLADLSQKTDALQLELAKTQKRLSDLTSDLEVANDTIQKLQALCTDSQDDKKEISRLRSECRRLESELKKAKQENDDHEETTPVVTEQGTLIITYSSQDIFPGEVRELLLAVLLDAQKTARNNDQARRQAVLQDILSSNPSTGELKRRIERLSQILKDADHKVDPEDLQKLEELQITTVSSKNHWKLKYGDITFPLSKTPSDGRSLSNSLKVIKNKIY